MAKGLRWAKGGSSSSNPAQHRHRDAARRNFKAQLSGGGRPAGAGDGGNAGARGLTTTALKRHDGEEGMLPATLEAVGAGPGNLFAGITRHMNSGLESHREACAVLAAVQELIREQGLGESETAYFGALMNAAEQQASPAADGAAGEGDGERMSEEAGRRRALAAIGQLLALVLPRVPPATLRSHFLETSAVFARVLEGLGSAEDDESSGAAAKHFVGCVGVLLQSLQGAQWAHAAAMQACGLIIAAAGDERPKIRKRAQDELHALLVTPPPPMVQHPASAAVAQHIQASLGDGTSPAALHAANFAKRVLPMLPQSGVKAVCEGLLRLVASAQPVAYSVGMDAIGALFDAAVDPSAGAAGLTPALNAQLLSALAQFQPSIDDAQSLGAWLATVTRGLRSLAPRDEDLCMANVARFVAAVVPVLLAERSDVSSAAGTALLGMVRDALGACPNALVRHASQGLSGQGEASDNPLEAIVGSLEAGLKFRYQPAWASVFAAVAALFDALGPHVERVCSTLLSGLIALRLSRGFKLRPEVEAAIGAAARAVGPRVFLRLVPLDIDSEENQTQFPKGFLVPLLKDNIRRAELSFLSSQLLPLAGRWRDRAMALVSEGRELESRPYSLLYVQIWALVPGFMAHCTDCAESFKSVAKAFGVALSDRAELRQVVCRGLTVAIANARASAESTDGDAQSRARGAAAVAAIARFGQNFLHALFKAYLAEPKPHILDAVAAFVQIADPPLLNSFFKTAVKNLVDASVSDGLTPEARDRRHSMMDLTSTMINRLDAEGLSLVCRVLGPQLLDSDGVLQKKTYKALTIICRSEFPSVAAFALENIGSIGKTVVDALGALHGSAKKLRFRCLLAVVSRLGDGDLVLIAPVVGEAVLGVKESGEKARNAAFDLLIAMANRMRAAGDAGVAAFECDGAEVTPSLGEYFRMVVGSLQSSVPHTISASIVALSRLIYEFKNDVPADSRDELIRGVIAFLASPSREIVRSALGFAKVAIVILPQADLHRTVPSLMGALSSWTDEARNHFKHKARVIMERLGRKIGFDAVEASVPESHRKLLANIRKTKEREKKRKARVAAGEATEPEKKDKKTKTQTEYEQAFYGSESEDDDDDGVAEEDEPQQPRRKGKGAPAWIREDEEGDAPLDFLGAGVVSRVVSTKPRRAPADGARRRNPFAVGDDGRIVVSDLDGAPSGGAMEVDAQGSHVGAARQKRKRDDDRDDHSAPAKKHAGAPGSRDDRPTRDQPQQRGGHGAKKRDGDTKKSGKLEPYSYVPLQPTQLNKRNRSRASGRFAGIVKAAQAGTAKGLRAAKNAAKR
eukprot:Opistho-2@26451